MNLSSGHGWAAIERFEDVRQLGRRNSQSLVLDADLDLLASTAFAQTSANADPAVRAAIFDCVGYKVLKALRKGRQVTHNFGKIRLDLLFHNDLFRLDQSRGVVQGSV